MYGLVNSALKDMIVNHFGEEKWQAIHRHSQVADTGFLTMHRYDDRITYQLAGAAAELLGAPIDDCMEMFGRHWVAAVAVRDFGTLMDATGSDTVSFLRNVNALHDRITSTFIDYIPPEFALEPVAGYRDRFHVHYHSERKGLTAFVTGLLHGLAEHFGDDIEIHSISIDDDGEGTHSIFEITVQ
ncbi:MAG: heme NO-binding domain-containing protein [Halieaceae bacterium]|jgi:guanylate cyclase soluble subunit beta|nr:heme NO-binding domain-containing protein [Halieaceae bacterium]